MFLCVKSISSNNRYISTFFASVQAYNIREFSNRQLLKHTKPTVTSTLLIEFLHFNGLSNSTPCMRKDYKLSNISRESSKNSCLQHNNGHTNFLLDNYCINNINNQNDIYQISKKISQISYISSVRDQLLSSNIPIHYKYHVSNSNQEKSWIYVNYRKKLIDLDAFTKDKTKVMNSSISTNALDIRKNSTNAPLITEKSTEKKPSISNLEYIHETLSIDLPNFFAKSMDYKIYHKDLEFVNNIRGSLTRGLFHYIKQLAFVRLFGHLKFAYVKLEILKITKHTEDNTIRVRWRINGTSGVNVLFSFWKYKIWRLGEAAKEFETWYDGYSTFYVGEDGLVYRHVVDKMMPDNSIELKTKTSITSELSFSSYKLKYADTSIQLY